MPNLVFLTHIHNIFSSRLRVRLFILRRKMAHFNVYLGRTRTRTRTLVFLQGYTRTPGTSPSAYRAHKGAG